MSARSSTGFVALLVIITLGLGTSIDLWARGGSQRPPDIQPCRQIEQSSISGRIHRDERFYPGTSSQRLPIRGVRMELLDPAAPGTPVIRYTTTDKEGRYRFDRLCPGEYQVRMPRDSTRFAALIYPRNDDVFVIDEPVRDLRLGGRTRRDLGTWSLVPLTGAIRGRVTHRYPLQSGIADAQVVIAPAGFYGPSPTHTSANGEFNIQGFPCCSRRYFVAVSKQGFRFDPGKRVNFPGRSDRRVSVNFEGIERVTMPRVLGRSWASVQRELAALRLRVQVQQEDNDVPALNGTIASQRPSPGSRISAGTEVRLTVYQVVVRVPDVVGVAIGAAWQRLKRAGFSPRTAPTKRLTPDPSLHDKVYRQSPKGGQGVSPGSRVTLTLWRKTHNVVPTLINLRWKQAVRQLNRAGFGKVWFRGYYVWRRESHDPGSLRGVLGTLVPPGMQGDCEQRYDGKVFEQKPKAENIHSLDRNVDLFICVRLDLDGIDFKRLDLPRDPPARLKK